MTKPAFALAALLLTTSAGAAAPTPASPAALSPEAVDKALYATGLSIAKNLEPFQLSEKELERLLKGVKDGVQGKAEFPFDDAAQQALTQLATARLTTMSEKEKVRGEEYLKKAAAEKGAVRRDSGLVYTALVEGKGATPKPTDKVRLNYLGTMVDGKEFGSSTKLGKPFEVQMDQVMPCWTEALGLMKVGGKAKVVCPPILAYGASGRPPQIVGNAVLVFALELVEIMAPVAPAPASPAKK